MSEPRLIKKYSNRRLYDTAASSYVNLDQVASLVRKGHALKVVDAKTGEDLTRQVLTQIIVEDARQPDGGAPVEFLRDMIRATDRAQRDFFEWYLSAAAEAYKRLHKTWGDRLPFPAGSAAQWEAWSRLWDPVKAFQGLSARAGRRGANAPPAPAEAPAGQDAGTAEPQVAAGGRTGDERPTAANERELADLRQRLEALERRLAGDSD
jgi:polyhydroxyalkanoate synthesis repressor PhaR